METKVKWEKAGKRKTEGWARNVVRILLCQQAKRPTRKPGRNRVANAMPMEAIDRSLSWSGLAQAVTPSAEMRANALTRNVRPQAKKMRMNLGERSPPKHLLCAGRIRHGPTFRFLARPREEVMMEVE